MKEPVYATLLLQRNKKFPIEIIHYNSKQVTLKEKENVSNTVSIKDVIFDFTNMSEDEIYKFKNSF